MMYLSRATLALGVLSQSQRWKVAQGGYGAHQLIWTLFRDHPDRRRDFLYRWDPESLLFTTLSQRPPEDREGCFSLEVKPFEPKLRAGQALRFRLRVNPVVKRRDDNNRQLRHDVVMDAKRVAQHNSEIISLPRLVQTEGTKWLEARAERCGFELLRETVATSEYHQHTLRKHRTARPVRYSSVDFDGVLRVCDVERFLHTLSEGIGPSKGFGCGLLLVKRSR